MGLWPFYSFRINAEFHLSFFFLVLYDLLLEKGGNGSSLQYSCWRIPWTEEPGQLQSMGSQRVGHN